MEFVVVVGSVGSVYAGSSRGKAVKVYRAYVEWFLSAHGGRGFVTLFVGGVPVREYDGEFVRMGLRVC